MMINSSLFLIDLRVISYLKTISRRRIRSCSSYLDYKMKRLIISNLKTIMKMITTHFSLNKILA